MAELSEVPSNSGKVQLDIRELKVNIPQDPLEKEDKVSDRAAEQVTTNQQSLETSSSINQRNVMELPAVKPVESGFISKLKRRFFNNNH